MIDYIPVRSDHFAEMAALLITKRDRDVLNAFIELLPENVKLNNTHFNNIRMASQLSPGNTLKHLDELIEVLKEEDRWE